jgi:hypothetical protein
MHNPIVARFDGVGLPFPLMPDILNEYLVKSCFDHYVLLSASVLLSRILGVGFGLSHQRTGLLYPRKDTVYLGIIASAGSGLPAAQK